MSLAWLSLGALVVAIVVSCTTRLNVGIMSLAFAWIVGVYFGGMRLEEVVGGFPVQLFLTLAGVTLLFSQAQINGTLDRLAHAAVGLCRGNVGLIPVMFFALGCGIASLGPGNVATAAMLAPMAMLVAARAGVPLFLMAIMVGNGAQAGALSPFAPTGIIVNGLMDRIDLAGYVFRTYWTNLAAHATLAFLGYFLFGGWRLFSRVYTGPDDGAADRAFELPHKLTLAAIFTVVALVLFAGANVGMAAFAAAVLLAVLRIADHEQAIRRMPWTPILMVSGVTVLITLLDKTGGLNLFTAFLAWIATRESVTGVVAFVTGVVSVYSSTSGVVLPAFLPTIPGLVARVGGDPIALASSMNIGAHLVDMSPLSTTGAVCLAGITEPGDVRAVYNRLLAWGLSMTVVGAIWCYLFF
ncbi:MAG: C4-dicarboxylate ABC transporter [Acidobacteria bacterium]|nr:C4-dicarboxylate ABC transporter [Acidobacteriota bacterium]